ncbi:MAG: F0F1 ATP synthase subunit B [Alphaproteobacteria bacterium]
MYYAATAAGGALFSLNDAATWVAVAFLIFVAFFVWKAVPGMVGGLDSRADTIKGQLDEARSLREESEKLLADYRHKHAQAMTEAEAIVGNAQTEAQNMQAKAKADLASLLERREKTAMEKISQAEKNAEQEVKAQAVNYAILATQELMSGNMSAKDDAALISDAIKELPTRLQ